MSNLLHFYNEDAHQHIDTTDSAPLSFVTTDPAELQGASYIAMIGTRRMMIYWREPGVLEQWAVQGSQGTPYTVRLLAIYNSDITADYIVHETGGSWTIAQAGWMDVTNGDLWYEPYPTIQEREALLRAPGLPMIKLNNVYFFGPLYNPTADYAEYVARIGVFYTYNNAAAQDATDAENARAKACAPFIYWDESTRGGTDHPIMYGAQWFLAKSERGIQEPQVYNVIRTDATNIPAVRITAGPYKGWRIDLTGGNSSAKTFHGLINPQDIAVDTMVSSCFIQSDRTVLGTNWAPTHIEAYPISIVNSTWAQLVAACDETDIPGQKLSTNGNFVILTHTDGSRAMLCTGTTGTTSVAPSATVTANAIYHWYPLSN